MGGEGGGRRRIEMTRRIQDFPYLERRRRQEIF